MIPTLIHFLQWTFPLAIEAKSMWGGVTKGGRHFSSVIQVSILNVIGSRNYVFFFLKFIMHSLKGASSITLYIYPRESDGDKVNLKD